MPNDGYEQGPAELVEVEDQEVEPSTPPMDVVKANGRVQPKTANWRLGDWPVANLQAENCKDTDHWIFKTL